MRALYDSKSNSLDSRGIPQLLSKEHKLETWILVEQALAKAQAKEGFIPLEAAKDIVENCCYEALDLEEMEHIQATIGHGFVPFLKVLGKTCQGIGSKYIHYGITTQNVQQTSQLYIAKEVHQVFKSFIADTLTNLAILANTHADTVMSGRTHGKHAVPITYGYKVAVWISEVLDSLERLEECEKRVFQVMMGGAVGAFNATGEIGMKVQERVADALGMKAMLVPSRNIGSHKTEYIMHLAQLCNSFHKLAEEVYYTGLEEFQEVAEGFTKGTVGSSTMPQKINPKLAKGIIANSQKIYSLTSLSLYPNTRMFEGDSSAYMLYDGVFEEALQLTTEVLIRAEELTRTLFINVDKMYQNATLNKGLDNSEYIMMCVAEKLGKDKAHALLYEKAMLANSSQEDYYQILRQDPILSSTFSKEELQEMMKPENYIGASAKIATDIASLANQKASILKKELQK